MISFFFLLEEKEEENVEYTVIDSFHEKFGPAVSIDKSCYAAYMTFKPVQFH